MTSALDGLLVLDFTRGAAGALTTMTLGDHGARVIRFIGPEDANYRSGGYVVWDRGKKAVRLSAPLPTALRAAPDAARLARAITQADVIIEDFSPGDRPPELEHARLSQLNPRAIVCSITAYGEHGPWRDEPPVDDLVLARAGVLATMPGFRSAPVHLIHPLPSTGAGLLAALGIAAALYDREESGLGRGIATSLLAGALLYHPKVVGENLTPNAFQTNPFGSAPFYSVYACADGQWIQLGCVHPGFIARAAALMGIAAILDDPVYGRGHMPKTPEADAYLRKTLTDIIATRPYEAWAEAFEANDVPFARSRLTKEGLDDPQIRHNQMVATLPDPIEGDVEQMGVPIKLSGTPGTVGAPRTPPTELAELAGGIIGPAPSGDEHATPASTSQARPMPLAGLRVLEITNLIAGPIAGRLLADLGADVMKLEPPAGDISRPIGRTYFYSVNYGKRSVCVDTSNDDGKALVRRIAAKSDVILANLRPGATRRMGIGIEADPDVIETQISGYGLTGPYATRPGIDPLAQALMGLQRAQGGTGNPPSFPAQLAPTDFTTGTAAALGTVMALYARRRGRGGQRVEVNLLDGGILLSSEWFTRFANRPERPLADSGQYGLNPAHRLYRTVDGFVYAGGEPSDIAPLAKALDSAVAAPDSTPTGMPQHHNETATAKSMAARMERLDNEAALQLLARVGIPATAVLPGEAAAFFDHPNTHANDQCVTRPHADAGALTVIWRYVQCRDAARPATPPTPRLGEHTKAVLAESGLSEVEIAGAIGSGSAVAV